MSSTPGAPGGYGGWPPPNTPNYPPTGSYPPPSYQYPQGQRQHAWRTANRPSGGGPSGRGPVRAPRSPRSMVWLAVIVVVVVALVGTHRITSTEVILFCILVPSLILHEVSHGVVALAFGDDTAKRAGRITLNPFRHVDLLGTIIVPAITILAGWGFFGWAKPVPVNVRNLRSPRNQGLLVSLAGPFTNVVLAAVMGVVFYLAFAKGSVGPVQATLPARVVFDAGVINLWVALFNMIPIPPLDGSALVERLLPSAWWPGYLRLRSYGMVIILGGIVLLSWAHVYPLEAIFTHLYTWWGNVVHAWG